MGHHLSLLYFDCTDTKLEFEGAHGCKAAATPVASASETEELRRIKDEAVHAASHGCSCTGFMVRPSRQRQAPFENGGQPGLFKGTLC